MWWPDARWWNHQWCRRKLEIIRLSVWLFHMIPVSARHTPTRTHFCPVCERDKAWRHTIAIASAQQYANSSNDLTSPHAKELCYYYYAKKEEIFVNYSFTHKSSAHPHTPYIFICTNNSISNKEKQLLQRSHSQFPIIKIQIYRLHCTKRKTLFFSPFFWRSVLGCIVVIM